MTAFVDSAPAIEFLGTPLPDPLIGSDLAETFQALGGDDVIEARGGADVIIALYGGDAIDGGGCIDPLDYTRPNIGVRLDPVTRLGQGGFAQGDLVSGIENVTGAGFDDALYGNALANVLRGGGASDLLNARGGDDERYGGAGDDIILGGEGADLHHGGEGADLHHGGDGRDTSDCSASAQGVQVSLAGGVSTGGDAAGELHEEIENLTGSDQGDALEGDGAANVLSGGRGVDALEGLGGDDTLIGGRDADALEGGADTDTASYRSSATGVVADMADGAAGGGGAEGDTFDSIEIVEESFHDDFIMGDGGDNILRGGLGADDLDGRGGVNAADCSTSADGVAVDPAAGIGRAGDAAGDTLTDIQRLIGSGGDDVPEGDAQDNVFDGGYGADIQRGRAGSDSHAFGFDSPTDTIEEQGPASDTDALIMGAGGARRMSR